MTEIFVYGTLKRGGDNHRYLAGQRLLGPARTVPGYRLFEAGGFPGMVRWPSDRRGVTGEVWSVSPACLQQLDILEGLAEGLYRREPVALLPPFEKRRVDTYLYLLAIDGRPEIGETWRE